MGYNTDYTVVVHDYGGYTEHEMIDWAREKDEDGFAQLALEGEYLHGKWYSSIDDMKDLSEAFPEAVFILYGVGEEYPDIWRMVFHKGESHKSEVDIVYSEVKAGEFVIPAKKESAAR